MTPTPHTDAGDVNDHATQVSRRQVTRGIAWSVPVIVSTAAAPAYAASSLPPAIRRSFKIVRESCSPAETSRIRVTTDDTSLATPSYYYQIVRAAGATVTQVTASVLVEVTSPDVNAGLTWTSNTADWSTPVRDTTQTYTDPATGKVYYRYVSTLLTAVPAPNANGVITLPRIDWQSSCSSQISSTSFYVNGRGAATLNGSQTVDVGPYRLIDADAGSAVIQRSYRVGRNSCSGSRSSLSVWWDNDATSYYRIVNAQPGATLVEASAGVLVQKSVVDLAGVNNVSWTSTNTAWVYQGVDPTLFYDGSGIAYYRFYFKYSGLTLTANAAGTITMPTTTFTSNCQTAFNNTVRMNGRGVATIDPGGQLRPSIGAFVPF